MTFVILHNMIIETECADPPQDEHPYYHQGPLAQVDHDLPPGLTADFATFLTMNAEI